MTDRQEHLQNPPEELQPEDLRPDRILVEHLDEMQSQHVDVTNTETAETSDEEDRISLYRRVGAYSIAAGLAIGGIVAGLSGSHNHESNNDTLQPPVAEQPLSTNARIGELQASYGSVKIEDVRTAGTAKDSSGNGKTNTLLMVQLDAPHDAAVEAGGRVTYGGIVVVLRNGPGEADDTVLTGISSRSGEKGAADASKVTAVIPIAAEALSETGTAALDVYDTATTKLPGADQVDREVTVYKVAGRLDLSQGDEKGPVKVDAISLPETLPDLKDVQVVQAPKDGMPVNPQHPSAGSVSYSYVEPVKLPPPRHPN